MSRPLRIEYSGAWYHVMNRGSSHGNIFKESGDYQAFLDVLEDACLQFNVFISSYCLMSNHYHLLVCTPEGNLSRFMRHVNGVYTQKFNRKYKRDGSLFRGRYKSILIQAEEYLLQVIKYIHLNPLEAKIVVKIEDYQWSSHRIYVQGRSARKWLDISSVLFLLSENLPTALGHYNTFMNAPLKGEIEEFYTKGKQRSILGNDSFLDWIKACMLKKDDGGEIEMREKRCLYGEKIIKEINYQVCQAFHVEESVLYIKQRGKENLPRLFAISLSREISSLSLSDIARMYEGDSYKTISSNQFRLKIKLEKNNELMDLYNRIKTACSQAET